MSSVDFGYKFTHGYPCPPSYGPLVGRPHIVYPPGQQTLQCIEKRIFAEVCMLENPLLCENNGSPDYSCMGPQEGSPEKSEGEVTSSYTPPLLPPCRVCGEKASGFHYGANTCEACKGFFRRSLARKEEYKCIGNEDCAIGVGKRNVCAFCRYQKCLAIGMSKSAIKTGRYTHEKKTRDIEEVKLLQKQEKQRSLGHPVILEPPAKKPRKEEEMETIIKHITTVHNQQTPHTKEFFEKLPEKENEFLEQRKLQQEMFGTLKPIPRDEYMQIYQTTGIDVDGRREMIKHMIPCIEKAIKRFIAFAKSLPGFKDLPIDDQIALIKVSRLEVWLIMAHKLFNNQTKLFTPFYGKIMHFEDMMRLQGTEYLSKVFALAEKMQSFQLSTDETCLFGALALMFTDRVPLKCPDKVEESQTFILEILTYMLKSGHPDHPHLLPQVLLALTELRTIRHLHMKDEERLTRDWLKDIEFPPLFYEMWSSYI